MTNAADRGLDMWSNFGTAVQVKHLTLDAELAECIAEGIMAEGVVIVCRDAEKAAIDAILEQVGWGQRIRGIVTLSDLEGWYALCLGPNTAPSSAASSSPISSASSSSSSRRSPFSSRSWKSEGTPKSRWRAGSMPDESGEQTLHRFYCASFKRARG
ncbi:MAG: HaeII family restriction endonuclease [Brevundimonas sp.]